MAGVFLTGKALVGHIPSSSIGKFVANGRLSRCCTQTGDALAHSKAYLLTEGELRDPLIPGSAHALSIPRHMGNND